MCERFPRQEYDADFELVEAHTPDVAEACNCDLGKYVGRIYPKGQAPLIQVADTKQAIDTWALVTMPKFKKKEA